jgi:hypothetical protein
MSYSFSVNVTPDDEEDVESQLMDAAKATFRTMTPFDSVFDQYEQAIMACGAIGEMVESGIVAPGSNGVKIVVNGHATKDHDPANGYESLSIQINSIS